MFRNYNSDEAVVQALLKGAIDYTLVPTSDLFEAVKDRPGITAVATSAEAFWQLSFNVVERPRTSTAHPAVLDPEVRHAIEYAIDRQTLVDRVLQGIRDAGLDADRAVLRGLALATAGRRVPQLRSDRGQPDTG